MKRKSKADFEIDEDNGTITILMRERYFWFFSIWVELTTAETENSPEEVLTFKSVKEAADFINNICTD